MLQKTFKDFADQAIHFTKQGMELMTEIDRLQQLARQLPKIESYAELVKEIIEKEKLATSFIGKATLIQRELLNKQRMEIEFLLHDL